MGYSVEIFPRPIAISGNSPFCNCGCCSFGASSLCRAMVELYKVGPLTFVGDSDCLATAIKSDKISLICLKK